MNHQFSGTFNPTVSAFVCAIYTLAVLFALISMFSCHSFHYVFCPCSCAQSGYFCLRASPVTMTQQVTAAVFVSSRSQSVTPFRDVKILLNPSPNLYQHNAQNLIEPPKPGQHLTAPHEARSLYLYIAM